MKNLQVMTDKFAIGLSFLCALHCLAFPLLLIAIPSFAALQLNNEAFHLWMVIAVIPSSIYALTVGCKKHRQYRLMTIGLIGLSFLVLALVLGHDLLGDAGEKFMTVLGAVIVSYGHYKNYRLCQQPEECGGSE